jgi:hypothetical protein
VAKKICTLVGVVFILVGIVGWFAPTLLGAHLSPAHNVVHLVSGVLALYFGLKGSAGGAVNFCRIFGLVYLALGVLGFVLGAGADKMWAVLPGTLELGTVDHVIHVLLGLLFLIGGFAGKK